MSGKDTTTHFQWDTSGKATFDGYDLAELADTHPTPFYLVSVGQLRDNYRRFREAFSMVEGLKCHYSVKSNFESIVIRTLCEEGCGAEVSGALDLELARRAGMKPDNVVFDGPRKTESELEAALRFGVHLIDIESMTEARMLDNIAGRLGKKINVGMRIDPCLSKPYYDKVISTYKKKFGYPIDQALAMAIAINELPNLKLVCIMTHIGSQVFTPTRYLNTLDKIFDLIGQLKARGVEIEEINLGGGYPAQSMRNMRLSRRIRLAKILERFGRLDADVKSIADFGTAIGNHYNELCRSTGLKPRLSLEPGRCLVSNAMLIVGRIEILKNNWLFTDISINDIPENLFFSEWRLVVPGQAPDGPAKEYNIAGPTLATQDVLYFEREVVGAREGSPFAILDIGAYSIARSNQFTRPRNAVYAVDADGALKLVRRAETVEDVLQTQIWDDSEESMTTAKTG